MDSFSFTLYLAATGIGISHTLLGPDHYLPFIMLARARHWSWARTWSITAACGLGHVISSVIIAFVGLAVGQSIDLIADYDKIRGDWAAYLFVAFGLTYSIWGLRRALRDSKNIHAHQHCGHCHIHRDANKPHIHENTANDSRLVFWALFITFVLGPCEPFIPIFMLPARRGQWALAFGMAIVFALVTVGTMIAVTSIALLGFQKLRWPKLEKWSHLMAGTFITLSGLAIVILDL